MKNKFVSSVRKFVKALDECKFDEAGRFLAPRCRYLMGQTELVGPEAIMRSYAVNAKWAADTLERVEYESEIQKKSVRIFDVLYTDRVFHHGLQHAYRCRQLLFLNDSGKIEKILHHDIPGEPEALKEFLARCGIERS